MQLAIDWARSRTVDLEVRPGETIKITCWPNASTLRHFYFATRGRASYIGLEVDVAEKDHTQPAGGYDD